MNDEPKQLTLTAGDIRKMTSEERLKLAESMAVPHKRCAPPWTTPDGYKYGEDGK